MAVLVVMLAFIAGALLAVGLSPALRPHDSFASRLERISHPAEPLLPKTVSAPSCSPAWSGILAFLQKVGGRRDASPSLRQLLDQAGHPASIDASALIGLRRLSILFFLLLAPLAARDLGATLPMKAAVVCLDLVIGLSLPDAWLQSEAAARQTRIRKALPDTLDLLVVSMEAGVGFDAAAAHAASAMRGPLADELRRALQEMGLGRTRAEALRALAARVAVGELTSFVAAVIQADRLGANLASVLRLQAETARKQRMQRIREAAAKLPTKMLFPLVFFLLPALFVVLLGPGLINLLNALSH